MTSAYSLSISRSTAAAEATERLRRGDSTDRMTEQSPDLSLAEASDDALITVFLQGEERAFRYLVERYAERIRNLVYSFFREPDLVADLSQDVFIKAYEALPSFRFESSFYTWLYRIAVNKCRDELRRRKVRSFLSFQSLDNGARHDLEKRLATPPDTHETRDLVQLALRAIPDHQRMVVVLKDLEGMSYEEIADVMEIEVGTVKSRLSRARATLRSVLEPLLREEPAS